MSHQQQQQQLHQRRKSGIRLVGVCWDVVRQKCRAVDIWLRQTLQANLEPLVALALIALLLLGTLALTGFLTMRIGELDYPSCDTSL